MTRDFETVLQHYIGCALWADTPEETPDAEASPEFEAQAREDVESFIALLDKEGVDSSDWTDEQFGHDFWLTRRHHGTGFWDRGFTNGDVLTKWSQTFSSDGLYVCDDGLLYSA